MGWGRVKQPTDVVNVGDEIEVYVLSADREKGKISLSLKKLISNPWDNAAEQFPVGTVLTGKVVRIAPFGAFVALADGVDGLVHISQISWEHIDKVEDALAIGQEVQVKVLEVDEDRKRISLSIKDLKERPVVEKTAAPAKPKKQAKPKSDVPEVNEELSNDAFASLADLLGEN